MSTYKDLVNIFTTSKFNYSHLPQEFSDLYAKQINKSKENLAWYYVAIEKDKFEIAIGAPKDLSPKNLVNYFMTHSRQIKDVDIEAKFQEIYNNDIRNITYYLLATNEESFRSAISSLISI